MKIRTKLYISYIIFSTVILGSLYILYDDYRKNYGKELHDYLLKELSFYRKNILLNFEYTQREFDSKQKQFNFIHSNIKRILQNYPTMNLNTIKASLNNDRYNIDIHIINKKFFIFNSTSKKDLGLNVSIYPLIRNNIIKHTKDNTIYQSPTLFNDFFSNTPTHTSYSHLNNNFLLISYSMKNTSMYTKPNNLSLYKIIYIKYIDSYYYEEVKNRDVLNKMNYLNKLQIHTSKEALSDKILYSYIKNKKIINLEDTNALLYAPLETSSSSKNINESGYVIKAQVDISSKITVLNEFKNKFLVMLTFIIIFILITFIYIHYKITKLSNDIVDNIKQSKKIENRVLINSKDELGIIAQEYNKLYESLYNEINKNQLLLEQNKQFIADMVHQIRTPLTVIMTNSSLIEMQGNQNVDQFLKQINSSISMLTNSYEDLSYIITHDTLEYKAITIDLSHFLQARVQFFQEIANANFKTIETNISNNIEVFINDIELERLIDNNISNAIKHSKRDSIILIKLYSDDKNIHLVFQSQGKAIQEPQQIFDKSYRESNSQRSLGLGLHMVKNICDKNSVIYNVESKDSLNKFIYLFYKK